MGIIEWFKNLFNKFLKAFADFAKAVFTESKKIIIGQLKDLALQVVGELEKTDLLDEEKRNEAFKKLQDYAAQQGINVSHSLIYLIIEMALQQLKDSTS